MNEEKIDVYAAQREELLSLLGRMKRSGEPLVVHGQPVLTSDEAAVVLQKLGRRTAFSRRERSALTEAGFDLNSLYPDL